MIDDFLTGFVYCGGYDSVFYDACWYTELRSQTSTQIESMPTPRAEAATVDMGRYVWIMGGEKDAGRMYK